MNKVNEYIYWGTSVLVLAVLMVLRGTIFSSLEFYVLLAIVLGTFTVFSYGLLRRTSYESLIDKVFVGILAVLLGVQIGGGVTPPEVYMLAVALGGYSFLRHRNTMIETFNTTENHALNPSRMLTIAILTGILTIGLGLRLWKLGEVSFWWDELLQIWAAEGLENGWPPQHPSGQVYDRNFPVTYLVYVVDVFGPIKEVTTRLPIAIISLSVIGMGYAIAARMGNRILGLGTAAFLAIYPPFIIASQEVRYYIPLAIYTAGIFLLLTSRLHVLWKAIGVIALTYIGLNSSLLILPISIGLVAGTIVLGFLHSERKSDLIRTYGVIMGFVSVGVLGLAIKKMYGLAQSDFFREPLLIFEGGYFTFLPPVLTVFFLVSFVAAILWLVSNKPKSQYVSIALTVLIFFTLLSTIHTKFSEPGHRYITFLIPLIGILVLFTVYAFARTYQGSLRVALLGVVLISLGFSTGDYLTGNTHFEVKQRFTDPRPRYRMWGDLDIPANATKVAMFPHTAALYVEDIDYALRKVGQGDYDPRVTRTDPVMGTPVITHLEQRDLISQCTYIFADHREETVWNEPLRNKLQLHFQKQTLANWTYVYVSHACNGGNEPR